MSKETTLNYLDRAGICASTACMVHCLVVPIFLVFGLDSLLYMIDNEWIEKVIVFTSLIIGLVTFLHGFLQHRQHFVPVLFIAGFLLLVNGEALTSTWESAGLSVAGALIIIYAHFSNLKLKTRASYR